jgi:pimeloyl-ACP methyl ester carboxylesterase
LIRFLSGLFWTVVVLLVLLHLVGGWYFSDVLAEDLLEVNVEAAERNLVVAEAGDGTVTLRPLAEEVAELTEPGVWGLDWGSGRGRIGDVVATGEDGSVTRTLLEGEGLEVGLTARLDGWVYAGDPQAALELPFTEVEYSNSLGTFAAWRLEGDKATWVVHVHGKGTTREEALRTVDAVARAGYPQLVITYRNDEGFPRDPSGQYQNGLTEWEDVGAAVALAVGFGAQRVVLYGYSTGAAHILSYMYQQPAPEVVGLVFDAPNIDVEAAVDEAASQRTLPFIGLPVPPTLTWVAKQLAAWRFDLDWSAINYVDRADQLEARALVFHGTADRTVPISVSDRFAAARPDLVRFRQVAGAGHVRSWNVDSSAYEGDLVAFLDQVGG